MSRAKSPENQFSKALKEARSALGIAQEAFSLASSRTYVSSLERGLKSPTLNKVDALSEVMGVHPLTLLTLSYADISQVKSVSVLQERVAKELDAIINTRK